MRLVDLKEFKKITRISDSALIWLLSNGALPVTLGNDRKIMIDSEAVEIQKLMVALNRELTKQEADEFNLLVEEAGKIIRDEFSSLVGEKKSSDKN